MFYSFLLLWKGLDTCLSYRFDSHSVVCRDGEVQYSAFFFFVCLLTMTRSGRLAVIMWAVCISKSQKSSCVSFSRSDSCLYIYHLIEGSNFNFLHNSLWITFPTQSCLVLYSNCANLLHPLIMWVIVSSLLPHNLHLLFFCVFLLFFFHSFGVFHTSFSWWYFPRVRMIESLPMFLWLFWAFELILVMLSSGLFQFFL